MIKQKLQNEYGFDLHTAQPPLFLQLFNLFKKFMHITKRRGGSFIFFLSSNLLLCSKAVLCNVFSLEYNKCIDFLYSGKCICSSFIRDS
ncbi:hypothetical protein JO41_04875 [Treponema sp. OMZ 838]|nr:hypothetical protein JO41_04875 [Treponema sp. OMZ 838]